MARLVKAKLWRRSAATTLDFVLAWFISVLLGGNQPFAEAIVFAVAWAGLRVFLVLQNQGQSPGHWALDMKVIDEETGRVPLLEVLAKREAVLGGSALLALLAWKSLSAGPFGLLLLIPLILDCGLAFLDSTQRQTFHDRWTGTTVLASLRGYSLDLKVRKLFAQARRFMK
jgi:uncharacterized RDD family membrane protein YckC